MILSPVTYHKQYLSNKYGRGEEEFVELLPGDIINIRTNGKNRAARISRAKNLTRYKTNNPEFDVNYLIPYEVHKDSIVTTQYRWTQQEFRLRFHDFKGLRETQRILDV